MIIQDRHFSVGIASDLPGAAYTAVDFVVGERPTEPLAGRGPREVVIEMYRAVGGLPQRALIGGQWTPDDGTALRVEVGLSGVTSAQADVWCEDLLGRTLIPGLANEFGDAVLTTLLSGALPSGRLVVSRAAYDPVESSIVAFRAAALLLVTVLASASSDEAEVAVRAKLDAIRQQDARPTSSRS